MFELRGGLRSGWSPIVGWLSFRQQVEARLASIPRMASAKTNVSVVGNIPISGSDPNRPRDMGAVYFRNGWSIMR
jgi:hypothetical protein